MCARLTGRRRWGSACARSGRKSRNTWRHGRSIPGVRHCRLLLLLLKRLLRLLLERLLRLLKGLLRLLRKTLLGLLLITLLRLLRKTLLGLLRITLLWKSLLRLLGGCCGCEEIPAAAVAPPADYPAVEIAAFVLRAPLAELRQVAVRRGRRRLVAADLHRFEACSALVARHSD